MDSTLNKNSLKPTLTTLDSESTGSTTSLDSAHAHNDSTPTNMSENNNFSSANMSTHDLFTSPRTTFDYPIQSSRSTYGGIFRQSTGGVLPNRRQSNLFNGGSLFNNNSNFIIYDGGSVNQEAENNYREEEFSGKSCCLECGMYTYLSKCNAHCDLQLCESCQQKHWQIELNELVKMKTYLESSVTDLKKYLGIFKL